MCVRQEQHDLRFEMFQIKVTDGIQYHDYKLSYIDWFAAELYQATLVGSSELLRVGTLRSIDVMRQKIDYPTIIIKNVIHGYCVLYA